MLEKGRSTTKPYFNVLRVLFLRSVFVGPVYLLCQWMYIYFNYITYMFILEEKNVQKNEERGYSNNDWYYIELVIGGSTYWTWEELSLTPDDTTVVKCITETCGGLHCSHIHRPYSCKITSCVDQSFMYFLKPRSGDLPQRSLLLVYYDPSKNTFTW